MTNLELENKISKIVDSFIMDIWITPYYCKKYIPSENIPKLKEKLFEEFSTKGGKTNVEKQ